MYLNLSMIEICLRGTTIHLNKNHNLQNNSLMIVTNKKTKKVKTKMDQAKKILIIYSKNMKNINYY